MRLLYIIYPRSKSYGGNTIMKRYISLLLCSILCLTLAACSGDDNKDNAESKPTSGTQSTLSDESSSKNSSETSSEASSDTSSEQSSEVTPSEPNPTFRPEKMPADFDPTSEEECRKVNFNSWQMYLANPWNPVPDNWLEMEYGDEGLAKVNQQYRPNPAVNSQLYFDARAIDYLHAMIEAAEDDGINLDVISAYRTNEFQTGNFQRQVNSVKANNPGISDEEAREIAATVVAKPGTSEHQLGLAVDFNSVEDSFRNTRAYKWLVENCTDYGFILRYEEAKQDKTGIIPEPWHYRYVGVRNAKLIEASGLCMEEFIEKYHTN